MILGKSLKPFWTQSLKFFDFLFASLLTSISAMQKKLTWDCSTGHQVFKLAVLIQQKKLVTTIMKWPDRVKCEKATANLFVDGIFFPP